MCDTVIESDGPLASSVTILSDDEFRGNLSESIPADLVLVAPSHSFNTEMVQPNLLFPDGTVRVNGWLSTANPDIFAVGDIAKFPSMINQDLN